jgi:hypothetical protein
MPRGGFDKLIPLHTHMRLPDLKLAGELHGGWAWQWAGSFRAYKPPGVPLRQVRLHVDVLFGS